MGVNNPMSESRKASGWMANELRTRFVPKSRMRNGLTSVAPWLDMVLIVFFFLFIESKVVLRPGTIIELPTATFTEGVSDGMVVVVMSMKDPARKSEVVFFNDESFRMDNPARMQALRDAFQKYLSNHDTTTMTIYADAAIEHGSLTKLIDLSRDIGLERVNFATKSPPSVK